jgi:hypothetical protein
VPEVYNPFFVHHRRGYHHQLTYKRWDEKCKEKKLKEGKIDIEDKKKEKKERKLRRHGLFKGEP